MTWLAEPPKKNKKASGGSSWLAPASESTGSSWLAKPSKSSAKSDDLDSRVADLEALNAETGAATPAQDSPGLLSRVVDVISRGNYAAAGAAEELFTQRGAKSKEGVLGRVGRELFSGVGSLKGDKEGFAQVMEQSGVGKHGELSDLLPFMYSKTGEGLALEKGGAFDPTGRGVAGFLGDVFLDPTTYLTLGASTGARVGLKSGTKYLSKQGVEEWAKIQAKHAPAAAQALSMTDEVAAAAAHKKVLADATDELEKALATNPNWIDKGGIKYFGHTVVDGDSIRKLGADSVAAMKNVPGGELAVRSASAAYDGSRAMLNSVFSAFPKLAGEQKGIREAGERLHRDFMATTKATKSGLFREWAAIEPEYRALVKADPDIGKKFYDIREGTAQHTLTPQQQAVYAKVVGMYDRMEQLGLQLGVLDPADLAKVPYFHHSYENATDLSAYAMNAGRHSNPMPGEVGKFQRSREFDTYDDAVKVSEQMNRTGMDARAAGVSAPMYPALKPNYDVMQNMAAYIHQFSDGVGRKQWADDIVKTFGIAVDPYMAKAVYDVATPFQVSARERSVIDRMVQPATNARDIDARLAKRALPRMSDAAKREFFREAMIRTTSPSQFAKLALEFDQYKQFFPTPKATAQGTVDKYWQFAGGAAEAVQRQGGIYGDKAVMIPKAIADDFENFSTKLFLNREFGPWAKSMLNGYDRLNNWFKTGVYTFWPASAFRDIYNNVAQSFLDVGIGAVARPMDTARVLRGDGKVTLNGIEYEAAALRRMAESMDVVDKSGRSFVQMTGNATFKPSGVMAKAVAQRAKIENWTRVQLWLNNINHGLDPRAAADKVREFLFSYDELNPVERELFRRAIPFYTFPRKAIELHLKALASRPGRLANEVKAFRGRDDENGEMTSWERNAFKMRLDRDGRTVTMITGVDLPVKTLDTLWRGGFKKTAAGSIGMLSPILKAPLEIGLGQSAFTGRKMDRAQSQAVGRFLDTVPTPRWAKDWMGYTKRVDEAGRPKYEFDGERFYVLFQSWALSRVMSTSERQFRTLADDGGTGAMLLDVLTGLRYKELNLDAEQQKMLRERVQHLEEAARRRGSMQQFQKTFKRKGDNPEYE